MSTTTNDLTILRPLAERFAEIANLDVQQERLARYRKTVALETVRPVVLISEVPWGEFDDDFLAPRCSDAARGLEMTLRRTLYQWDHFQVDLVVPPVYRVAKRIRSTGLGLQAQDHALAGDSGTHICAHEYEDLLQTEEDLAKLQLPEISYDREATERAASFADEVFDGLLPVEITGHLFSFNMWDLISRYRGVDSLLLDLVLQPDLMHKIAERFTQIGEAMLRQYQELGLLDYRPLLVHCTIAATDQLPAKDFAGTVRLQDTWGRCAAQIFGSVSPAMHDEFDLAYNQRLFGDFGLLYYGCCEPMDNKIDILRKRFKNLRKISITPWADPERAAANIGADYVLAGKPNPAFVGSSTFAPGPVEEEIARYLEACRKHGTPCEFVLKDISTVANNPENLTRWADTVRGVVDRYF